ncbi:MAG: thioredoxin family protein [Saprospiraceae bacterium]|nr:thioredoxin family protein [Saprospiraceae bacterium]
MNVFPFFSLFRISLFFLALPILLPAQSEPIATAPLHPDSLPERPVLLVFSGSDWCVPCIRLEQELLSDSVFLAFANRQLSVVKADFPQRKKLSAAQEQSNEQLAARYNPEGAFPKLLLLRPNGSVWATLHWKNQDARTFVDQLNNWLQPH